MELSVVIPIYHTARNAIAHLPNVISSLRSKFDSFEIIFIIDNETIREDVKGLFPLQEQYREIRIQQLDRNHGQHFATLCGFYIAQGDFILSVDEDMTRYVTAENLSKEFKEYDVFFLHYNKNSMYGSVVRKLCSILFKALIHRIINFKKNSTFRIIRKELRDAILTDKHIFWNIDVMIFNHTNNLGGRTIEVTDLKDDNSSYNYKTLISIAFEIAYEHNTILMNFILALLPAAAIHLWYGEPIVTAGAYVFLALLITFVFMTVKKLSLPTEEKILKAIRAEVRNELFEPVTD